MTIAQYYDWVAFGVIIMCWLQMAIFSLKSMGLVEKEESFKTCIKSFFIFAGAASCAIVWLIMRYILKI